MVLPDFPKLFCTIMPPITHTHTGLWLLLTSRVDEIMCLLESGFTAILAQYFRTPAMTPGIQYSRACDCSEYHYTPSLSNSAFCVSSVDLVLTHLHACVTHTSYQTACTHSIVCVCACLHRCTHTRMHDLLQYYSSASIFTKSVFRNATRVQLLHTLNRAACM